jgi:hypothetical protein
LFLIIYLYKRTSFSGNQAGPEEKLCSRGHEVTDVRKAQQSQQQMSKTVGASFLPHSSSSLPDQSSKNAFPTSTLPATELLAPATTPSSLAGPSTWQAPLQWNANQPVPKAVMIRKSIRASRRTTEEQEIESRTASRSVRN